MMVVDPLSGYDIEFVVLNSGHPENVWTLNVENTTTGFRCESGIGDGRRGEGGGGCICRIL